jgi:hypothetical protein
LLTVVVALAAAAPSGAVVGGEPVTPESVPRFAGSRASECQGSHLHPDFVESTLALPLIEVGAGRYQGPEGG